MKTAETSQDLATWASLLAALTTLLGILQSQTWLTALGLLAIGTTLIAFVILQGNQRRLRSAMLSLDGVHLDSLNLANLRRRLNKDLLAQRAYHMAVIEGEDLFASWQCEGYVRNETANGVEFSIDAERAIPFESLECVAHDLVEDPSRKHGIAPVLVGPDGLSKKVIVPFLKPIASQQAFNVVLTCKLPGCLKEGTDYYTSSLSFTQKQVGQLAVHLIFIRDLPRWVRVYECDERGRTRLIKELRPFKNEHPTCEYLDLSENAEGQSLRIYVFDRPRNSTGSFGAGQPP